jgi:hypothetical protein
MEYYQTIIGIFLGIFSLERGTFLTIRRRKLLYNDNNGVKILLLFIIISLLLTIFFFKENHFSLNIFKNSILDFIFKCVLYILVFTGCRPILNTSYSEHSFYRTISYFDKNFARIFMFSLFLRLFSMKHFFILIP